jgi:transposase InsO family protein
MQTICGLFGYTRQAYYKSLRSNTDGVIDDCRILLHVENIRKLMPRLGTRKLHYMLQEEGVSVSRDRLFDILREHRMLVRRRKKRTVTTNSRHWMKKYPNLIRGFKFDSPNQLWVSDITYISIEDTYAYLSLITDASSRKIMGYYFSRTLESEGSLRALKLALSDHTASFQGLIHHSDRGVQYCCKDYVELLKANKIRISMTENGDPYENALAERVNGILKDEWLDLEKFHNFQQAKERISQVVKIYNEFRPHLSCGMKTPAQKHNHK